MKKNRLRRQVKKQSWSKSFLFILLLVLSLGIFAIYINDKDFSNFNTGNAISKKNTVFVCPTEPRERLIIKPDNGKNTENSKLLDSLTRDMTNKVHNNVLINKDTFLSLSKTRKKLLISAMRETPDSAIFSTLFKDDRDSIARISKNCIETIETLEGRLEIIHADFFNDRFSREKYTLITANNEYIDLHPAFGLRENLLSGMVVRVKGLRADNDLLFDGRFTVSSPNGEFGGIDVLQTTNNPPVYGDQKTIVVLVNFVNTVPSAILTPSYVNDLVFVRANSYYRENSYNLIGLSGSVLGYYNMQISQTCDYNAVATEALRVANPDVNFNDYSRLIIVAPFGSCGWSGLSTIDKSIVNTPDGSVLMSIAWINSPYVTDHFTFIHELGHGFGNGHANLYNCGDVSISAEGLGCAIQQYGDLYDVMGNGMAHFNTMHKDYVGWFSSSNIREVFTNGLYTIEPIETATNGLKSIKIRRGVNDYLFVEYRQPIGWDIELDTGGSGGTPTRDIFLGALLHTMYVSANSLLIDATPPITDLFGSKTAVLPVGQTLIDPATASRVTLISKDSTSIVVDVSLGKTDFTPPIVNITPLSSFSGIISIKANAFDESGIDKVEFYHITSNGLALFDTDYSEPYEAFLNASKLRTGGNYVNAIAYDNSGKPFGVAGNSKTSANVGFIIAYNDGDHYIPIAIITSPKNASYQPTNVNIEVYSLDSAAGMWKVEFYKDDNATPFYTDLTNPYNFVINLADTTKHALYAMAYDLANNIAKTNKSFITIDGVLPSATLTTPTNGKFVWGITTLAAQASDNIAVNSVEFYLDNALFVGADSASPYSIDWNTVSNVNGVHLLYAKAIDSAGNQVNSGSISITINNTGSGSGTGRKRRK